MSKMDQTTTDPEVNSNPKASEPHPNHYTTGESAEVEAKKQQEAEGEDPAVPEPEADADGGDAAQTESVAKNV